MGSETRDRQARADARLDEHIRWMQEHDELHATDPVQECPRCNYEWAVQQVQGADPDALRILGIPILAGAA